MFVDQVQFEGATNLLSDIPESLGCHDCAYSSIDLFIYDHLGEETYHQSFRVDNYDDCFIPLRSIVAEYMDYYQLNRFMGEIKVMEDEDNYEYWQVDIVNSILNFLNLPDEVCFTGNFADSLDIASNADTLTVEVTAESNLVHRATYTPYQNSVKVYDFASILENYLLSRGYSCCSFSIKLTEPYATITRTIFPIFCRRRISDLSANTFYPTHFLTTNTSRLTSPGVPELLPLIAAKPPVNKYIIINYYGTYLLDDASTYSRTYSTSQHCSDPLVSLDASATTIDALLRQIGTIINGQLVSYTIAIDSRRCTFYVTHAPATRSFLFRNAFNCWETLHIFASTKTKLASEYATAICGDQLYQYNVEHTQTFEEQTAALVHSHALWFREFLTSPDIRPISGTISDPSLLPRVLINSYTSELTNAPSDAANAITFEWQYSSRRGFQTFDSAAGIFTEQFTAPFN